MLVFHQPRTRPKLEPPVKIQTEQLHLSTDVQVNKITCYINVLLPFIKCLFPKKIKADSSDTKCIIYISNRFRTKKE